MANHVAAAFGVEPRRLASAVSGLPRYVRTAIEWRRQQRRQGTDQFAFEWSGVYPCLSDWRDAAGSLAEGGHYFYQDLWAARKIYRARPLIHLDIGSRIDGFVTHLLCFMPVTVIDIRPFPTPLEGLTFIQDDATTLAQIPDSSVESLSSLHAVEHFGLGRYGDPVDPAAPFKAMESLARVLRPGGRLYFAVPLGRERLEFNAHRVFSPETILKAFEWLQLASFSAVDDQGRYLADVPPDLLTRSWYACGLFEFTK